MSVGTAAVSRLRGSSVRPHRVVRPLHREQVADLAHDDDHTGAPGLSTREFYGFHRDRPEVRRVRRSVLTVVDQRWLPDHEVLVVRAAGNSNLTPPPRLEPIEARRHQERHEFCIEVCIAATTSALTCSGDVVVGGTVDVVVEVVVLVDVVAGGSVAGGAVTASGVVAGSASSPTSSRPRPPRRRSRPTGGGLSHNGSRAIGSRCSTSALGFRGAEKAGKVRS